MGVAIASVEIIRKPNQKMVAIPSGNFGGLDISVRDLMATANKEMGWMEEASGAKN